MRAVVNRLFTREPSRWFGCVLVVLCTATMSGCVFWPHKTSQYSVNGSVFDNHSDDPIRGAAVELRFPETGEEQRGASAANGRFALESDGSWQWFIWFWDDDEVEELPVELRLSHPDYDAERFRDLKVRREGERRVLNAGYLYLERKR
ncbi:MAG: carboxypeptidase regulatory-like domain-containing protein [Bdellovibrionales bacterium]|nr:carboxypeptidase regulatory-like domain-containing protein [Bdellovibrionales bacterium]